MPYIGTSGASIFMPATATNTTSEYRMRNFVVLVAVAGIRKEAPLVPDSILRQPLLNVSAQLYQFKFPSGFGADGDLDITVCCMLFI